MTENLELIPLTITDATCYSYFFADDVLNDEEIRFLINAIELNQNRYDQGKIGDGVVSPEIRRSKIGWLNHNDQSLAFFYERITENFKKINQLYFRYALHGLEQTQFTKYVEEESGHYSWHKDDDPTGFKQGPTRKLSSVLFLSDPKDYEGGELQICNSPENIITIEPKKGRMVFFPSFTIHRVNPVTKGIRYTAVNWARGPAFV